MDETYKGLGADGKSDFKALYNHDSVSNPEPTNSPVDVANNPKTKNAFKGTSEGKCDSDSRPMNQDSTNRR